MSKYTEGNYLGQDSTEYLITQLLDNIRNFKGFCVQTFPAVLGRPIVLTGSSDIWTAHGTLLSISQKVYLTEETKFRFFITAELSNSPQIIPAIYRFSRIDAQTDLPIANLVGYGDASTILDSGWCIKTISHLVETSLSPTWYYYLVLFYKIDGTLNVLGNPGIHSEYYPYFTFTTQVDSVSPVPESILMTNESNINLYGSIYLEGSSE